MSATVAPRVRNAWSASTARATPCSPAPRVISRPRTRSSAMTGQAVVAPNGGIVPRSYPVACRATSALGMDRRLTPSSWRSLGQEMVRSPGTSTNTKSSSARRTTRVFTMSAGVTPRTCAASARLPTGPCRTTRCGTPDASAASRAGLGTVPLSRLGRGGPRAGPAPARGPGPEQEGGEHDRRAEHGGAGPAVGTLQRTRDGRAGRAAQERAAHVDGVQPGAGVGAGPVDLPLAEDLVAGHADVEQHGGQPEQDDPAGAQAGDDQGDRREQ